MSIQLNNKCYGCGCCFSTASNLKKHVKKLHPDYLETIPSLYKNSENFKFVCEVCSKNFNHKRNLTFHMKTHNESNSETSGQSERSAMSTNSKKCPMCNYCTNTRNYILAHFTNKHEITVISKEIAFPSFETFLQWKSTLENEELIKFGQKQKEIFKQRIVINYTCHRSGNYVPKGNGLRHLKTQGSAKMNAYCPASIRLIKDSTGECKITFIETHVGHQTDIGHLTLTTLERRNIAAKIAAKIPFDDILDEVRDSIVDSNLKRIHLINRKDLHNIESSFNLNTSSIRHSNDAISVDSWVTEMKRDGNSVLFYKPQGTLDEEYPDLKESDFLLMIMTPSQMALLQKYGSDCVCLDGTHGLNSYDFELFTILVLDELREGFPGAFLISNRGDKEVFKLFLTKIKELSGILQPNIFMSDLAEGFYNAWVEVMGIPEKRLFCTWHVDRAWRKNLSRIRGKELQISVYKHLRTLLEERDVDAFNKMIVEFCSSTDSEILDFITYFKDTYGRNTHQWAYCHRLYAGINTNMSLERMHRTIKYFYFKGKKIKRLDKSIVSIMKFVRDKLIDRLIVINKGKISSKIKDIRSRHKNMEKLKQTLDHSLIIKTQYGWEVPSERCSEIYCIQEVNAHCTCRLICPDCKICLHRYVCTCVDASIKYNMCKHIHLIARLHNEVDEENCRESVSNFDPENVNNPPMNESAEDNTHDDDDNVNVDCDETGLNVTQVILSQLSKEKKKDIMIEKEKLKMKFLKHLESIESPTKLEIMKKVIAPLSPTMAAAEKAKIISLPTSGKTRIPHNAAITAQRRLFSTKKKPKKAEKAIQKPNVDESLKIAMSLLKNKSTINI